MKVLMFGWEFPPHIAGGLGTACYGLTKGLSHAGVEVIFVVPKVHGGEDRSFLEIQGASDVTITERNFEYDSFLQSLTYLEVGVHLIPYLSPEEYSNATTEEATVLRQTGESSFSTKFEFTGTYGKDLMAEVSKYAAVGSALGHDREFDLIHAHDWLTYPAGIAAKRSSGKPLVVHVHATEFDRSGENVNQTVYDIEKQGMEAADRVITVSHYTRAIVINRYGIDPEKVVTVHNAVEPTDQRQEFEFRKGVDEKIVTFLGRITFQKGPEYFVEAARKVLKRNPNVRFVMAGSGDLMNKIIRRVAELGISDRFHFAGFLKGAEVYNLFDMSDVYVMPSVSEPFGISPLEAMKANVPVIISKQSGVAEVLPNSIKVDFWDIDAMADAIHGLINYPGLVEEVKNRSGNDLEKLKWDEAGKQVRAVYASVVPQS